MKITVRIDKHYGTTFIYPVCKTAQIFCDMTHKKTLTDWTIAHVKKLGYIVEVEQQVVEL